RADDGDDDLSPATARRLARRADQLHTELHEEVSGAASRRCCPARHRPGTNMSTTSWRGAGRAVQALGCSPPFRLGPRPARYLDPFATATLRIFEPAQTKFVKQRVARQEGCVAQESVRSRERETGLCRLKRFIEALVRGVNNGVREETPYLCARQLPHFRC